MTNKNTICLWFDSDAVAAATFYAKTFPDSAVGAFSAHQATILTAIRAMS